MAALGGCADPKVVRIVDGRPETGRFISEGAYALYAYGAEAEARGNLGSALRGFSLAAREDPDSPEVWTRLGTLHCRTGPPGAVPRDAVEAFDRAEALDPGFGPLHRERARCLLAHGDAPAALVEAERALALDPDDLPTALTRGEALERAGQPAEARRAFFAAAARRPAAVEPWLALVDLARRAGDAALARAAAEHAVALSPALAASLRTTVPDLAPLAAVDAALRAGDLAGAQHRALAARLPGAELALRAAASGHTAMAREQAELVLGADPADASARIALAAAADLSDDLPALAAAMRGIPLRSTPPSRLGRLLFAEILARRTDAEAARAWLGPMPSAASEDPLLAAVETRVRAALSGP
jgi:tetratricopeptide (TPR) repeat protein